MPIIPVISIIDDDEFVHHNDSSGEVAGIHYTPFSSADEFKLGHDPRTQTISVADSIAAMRQHAQNVRFSNRPFGVKHFQTNYHRSVNVAYGLVLLFGTGTKALVWGLFRQEV